MIIRQTTDWLRPLHGSRPLKVSLDAYLKSFSWWNTQLSPNFNHLVQSFYLKSQDISKHVPEQTCNHKADSGVSPNCNVNFRLLRTERFPTPLQKGDIQVQLGRAATDINKQNAFRRQYLWLQETKTFNQNNQRCVLRSPGMDFIPKDITGSCCGAVFLREVRYIAQGFVKSVTQGFFCGTQLQIITRKLV